MTRNGHSFIHKINKMSRKINSRKVFIRLKKDPTALARLGTGVEETTIYNKKYIGSSFEAGTSRLLTGLTLEEEEKFLPPILGVSVKDNKWASSVKTYYANLRRLVPPTAEGLQLEVGMIYDNSADYDKALVEEQSESLRLKKALEKGQKVFESFKTRTKVGTPIDTLDYIIWRYCLKYNKVANTEDDAFSSPNIEFYLYSEAKMLSDQKVDFEERSKAMQIFYQIVSDNTKKSAMLYVLKDDIINYNSIPKNTKKLSTGTEVERNITLETIARELSFRFLTVAQDSNLMYQAFIEKAIDMGELRRLPNTTIIMYGSDVQLGKDMIESIAFLNASANRDLFNTLKARINLKDENVVTVETEEKETTSKE